MGTGEGEEQTVKIYSVVTDYPAIVRFDFAFWARKIAAQSLKKYCETALACVAFKSAVDPSKLAFNDFLSLYAPVLNVGFGNDPKEMINMINKAKEVYSMYSPVAPQSLVMGASGHAMSELEFVQGIREQRGVVVYPAVRATEGNF